MRRSLLALLLLAAAALPAADAWIKFDDGQRPLMAFETLKGYRLFFHPDEREPLRRSLVLQVPVGMHLKRAYLLIRPYSPQSREQMAWLRVEGYREFDYVRFDWDGTYRRDEFADGLYRVDVRVTLLEGDERRWQVVVAKSADYPRFVKAGGQALERLRHLALSPSGEFLPKDVELTLTKTALADCELQGRVWLPALERDFEISGALVALRRVAEDGRPKGDWECLSRQELPADSPARKGPKRVAFHWPLKDVAPGLYDLKLALYHGLVVNARRDECDVPQLDGDVLRLRVVE